MKKVSKVLLWIIALILFPITAGLYFIWPSKIFKDRMSQNWKRFWWVIYILNAVPCIIFKLIMIFWFLTIGYGKEGFTASVSRDDVQASEYRTSEDFYKLTGVEFPELEMVDSLFFQDGGLPTNWWREYKFVAKGGLNDRFKLHLERACVTDSTHWTYTEGSVPDFYCEGTGERMIGDQMVYHYEIYPDKEPVDRNRGMCDRMIEGFDGIMVPDWDGSYITVDVVNDTIILRNGWVR